MHNRNKPVANNSVRLTHWSNSTTTSRITPWHTSNCFLTNSHNINSFIRIVSSRAMTISHHKCSLTIASLNRLCWWSSIFIREKSTTVVLKISNQLSSKRKKSTSDPKTIRLTFAE